ncbi:Carbohydrate-responsive element-binding protein [Quillaja saponaria]|uniref:Carbohydrate-responsive element-binding protein n=1 Tax=Quillaja saponaria TaxID=32244 RepID=A0AAD7VGZ7_QUISA|nr:Carbohydrate-responsive element-binding protein [Quillaja saponaria]
MEDCIEKNRKRARDDLVDSESDSPQYKITRVNLGFSDKSLESKSKSPESELAGVDSYHAFDSVESELIRVNSPDTKLLEDDLLNILEAPDNVTDREPVIQGLDSIMKSFEEEILVPADPKTELVNSGESQPHLIYLLEASDDELGLPPTVTSSTSREKKVKVEEFGEFLGFENDMVSYDSLEFGVNPESDGSSKDEFVALSGLFDYAEPAVSLWRHESLQAL